MTRQSIHCRYPVLIGLCLSVAACAVPSVKPDALPQQAGHRPAAVVSLPAEKVRFPSLDADLNGETTTIEGLLVRPKGPGPFPAVVALHGCSGLYTRSGRLSARETDWAERLAGYGYAVLFPDSFTPRRLREVCTRRDVGDMPSRERPRDAYGALRWLQSQDFIRGDRIVLMGWSHGGSTVLAAIDGSAAARPAGLTHDFRGAIAFYPGCRVAAHATRWRTRIPLVILIGEADDWTPAASCVSLVERVRKEGGPVEIVIYRSAHHGFDIPGQPLRVRSGLARTTRRDHTATVGEDPVSHADAILRVETLLKGFLGP